MRFRTTVRLDEHLLAEAKRRSKKSALARLSTIRGDGLQPGVDLDDTAALLALMDETR